MQEYFDSRSSLMARLTISAIDQVTQDPKNWKEPSVHKALLVSGLSVLVASTSLLNQDIRAL